MKENSTDRIFQLEKELAATKTELQATKQAIEAKEIIYKKTEQLLEQTNQVARVGGWEVDFVNNTNTWTGVTKAIHEVAPDFEPQVHKGIQFYKEGESRDKITRLVGEAIANGTSFDTELIIVTAKGNERWVRAKAEAEMIDGKCIRFYGTFQDIHEQKLLQQELEVTLANLQGILDASVAVSIIRTDNQGVITHFNKGAEKLLGYTAAEIIGKQTPAIIHKAEEVIQRGEELSQLFGEKIEGFDVFVAHARRGQYDSRKWTYIAKDGTTYTVQLVVTAIRNSSGETIGFLGIATDISDLIDRELIDSERKYRLLIENLNIGVVVHGAETEIMFHNDKALQILRLTPNQMVGKTAISDNWSFLHPDGSPLPVTEFPVNKIKQSLEPLEDYLMGIQHNVNDFLDISWVMCNAHPIFNQEKQLLQIIVNFNDVTERVLAEREIKASREKLQIILDQSADIICTIDEQNNFTSVSAASQKVIGYTPAELEGQPFALFLVEKDQEKSIKMALAIQAGKEATNFVNRYVHKNGSIVFMSWSARWDTKTSTMYCIGRNTTELRNAEVKLREYNHQITNILESITDGFFTVNTQWIVTYWNKEAEKILGMPRNNIIGKNLWDLYEIAKPLKFYSETHKAVEQQISVHFEEYLPLIQAWLSVSAYPSESGLSIYFKDVTLRRNQEGLIRQNEERLNEAQHISKVGSWEYSFENGALHWSSEHYRIFEVEEPQPQAMLYELYRSKIHPEDLKVLDILMQDATEYGEGFRFEHRAIFDDGRIKYVIGIARAVKNEKGKTVLLKGTVQDITEHKLANEKIRISEERLKEAQQISKVGSWEFTFKDQKLYWSSELYRIFEIKEPQQQELLYELCRKKIHPDDLVQLDQIISITQQTGKGGILEHRAIFPDGRIKHLIGISQVVRDRNDAVVSLKGTVQDISEQKLVNEKIRISEERYHLISKATNDAIWDWDIINNDLFCGIGYKTLFGYDIEKEPFTIEKWQQSIHPDDAEKVFKSVEGVLENPAIFKTENEYRFCKVDGSYATVLDRSYIIRDKDGQPIRLIGALQDITRLRKDEEQLRLLSSVITHTNDAVLITEAEPIHLPGPRILYVNEAFTKMTGYLPEEVIGKTPRILQGPKTDRDILKELKEKLENWQSCDFDLINYTKEGEEFWVNISIVPVANEKGWFTHWISVQRDITERKRYEQELRKNKDKIQQSLNELSHQKYALDQHAIVAITDINETMLYANDRFCAISQYSQQELIGENHRIINSGFHSPAFFTQMKQTITAGKVWHGEIQNKAKDGSVYWVETTVVPFMDKETGKPIQYIGISSDITQRKNDELALRELNEQVRLRAEELAISNAELEHFAYIASHDLQEPLRMVTSFLTLLDKKYKNQLDDKAKQYIHFAVDGSIRMRRIILDLLEYSRAGRHNFNFEAVNINQLLTDVMQLNRTIIEEKEAQISWDKMPTIVAAPTPLQQVFQNLLSNALKYQHVGKKPVVKIGYSETKTHWNFFVTDNGMGIEEQYFEKIFIIFQRLHNKEEYSGTGIGLAICKKIIETHQGKIWIKSVPNQGTTFYFSIKKTQ